MKRERPALWRHDQPLELNPVYHLDGFPKATMRLTEICHDSGNRAAWGADNRAPDYCRAYYDQMAGLAPLHPALRDFIRDEGLTVADVPELERQRFHKLARHLAAMAAVPEIEAMVKLGGEAWPWWFPTWT